jgi:4-hydroxybenzoate polyprenyltransferase
LLFALVGLGFLIAAPLLDSDLAIVGLILVAVAVFMFATFWILAYRAFGRERGRPNSTDDMRRT